MECSVCFEPMKPAEHTLWVFGCGHCFCNQAACPSSGENCCQCSTVMPVKFDISAAKRTAEQIQEQQNKLVSLEKAAAELKA
eukprot:2595452-Rhodomonas_salina.1